MTNKPESTGQLLNNSIFQDMLRRIEIHAELLRRIKERLPDQLAAHCQYCVVREDGGLVLFTDSPAWASQLRFHSPSILAALNAAGEMTIKQVLIRNLRITTPSMAIKPIAPIKTPPAQAIEMIKTSSKSDPSGELGEALARLGATMELYARKNQTNAAPTEGPDGVGESGF